MLIRLIQSLLIFVLIGSITVVCAQKPELVVQTGHSAQVLSVAFSSDGKLLASASVDNTVKLWDPASGNELRALKGHSGSVMSVAFSPDNKVIASGSADNTVKLWDVNTGAEKQTLRGHTLYVSAVRFSPDGKLLATASADQKVKIWNPTTGQEIRTLSPGIDPQYSLGLFMTFTPDGKTLITGGEVVKLWDVATGRLLNTIKIPDAGMIPILPVAVSPDSKYLVISGKDVRLFDLATAKQLMALPGEAESIVFSSDGKALAGIDRTEVTVWEIPTGKQLRNWEAMQQGVDSITYSPDGRTIATGNSDNTIRLWDAATGTESRILRGYTDSVQSLAISEDGKLLASGVKARVGRDDTLRVWDPVTGQLVRPLVGASYASYSIDLSSDGSRLVAAGGGGQYIGMWNPAQSDQLKKFQASGPKRFTPTRVKLSPDGRFLAAGGRDGELKMWEVESGREVFSASGHQHDVRGIAFSPNGDLIATSGQDGRVKLWSMSGQLQKTLIGHSGGVIGLAFSPDGRRLASGSQDKTVFLWNIERGDTDAAFWDHKGWVTAVAFSPDGKYLASGQESGQIRVWDVKTKAELRPFEGHKDSINSMVFSADSKLLITGSHDTSTRLWDVNTGKELASLFALGERDWLVLTPDGLFDGSPAAWNQILWRFSSNLFDVAPVELFFNEYYSPGLLADLHAGKRPVAPQNISQKDRRQPTLRLSVDEAQVAAARPTQRNISVKIDVSAAPAGAQDLRLFRNGALVKVWRGDVLKGQSKAVLETSLPIVAGTNRLTAYAFNRDNVKSADATLTINGNDILKQPGTLYILAIAVNKYANSHFDLRYAVADATDFASELQGQEAKLKNYARTEIISLYDAKATKPNILGALKNLATRVKPEDAVVVYYAGHGTAQENQFYLIPHDLGYLGPRNKVDAASLRAVLTHSISDRELEQAFEGIDAGRLLLVIDACNSGQALEAEEKRRGPMNSKGLAQLAYEKGIYILTAAQSYQAAMEPSDLKHGLLTYTLVEEGLKQAAADVEPKDGTLFVREWFSYVMKRVPQMQEQRMRAASESGRQLVYVDGDENTDAKKRNVQRPRVFYRRELEDQPFVIAKVGSQP